jgi:hypothetical protein
MTMPARFTKAEILSAFEREDRSYRLGMMCTHWLRDVERYTPSAMELASNLHMKVDDRWVRNNDLAASLADPAKRELLSSDFLLTYLHTLIRAPFELLSDYCEDFDRLMPGHDLVGNLKSMPWYPVAYIVRNAVSHNFRVQSGRLRHLLPLSWRTITITEAMEGQPMTSEIFWHKPGYELFLEMLAFADAMPEESAQ